MSGTNIKNRAKVAMVMPEGLYLIIEDRSFFAGFGDFPCLAAIPLSQVFQVEYCGHGHIRWEEADIDLNTKILAHPEDYPIRMQTLKMAASEMGRHGGSVRSTRKAKSSAANGLRGGRPAKKREMALP